MCIALGPTGTEGDAQLRACEVTGDPREVLAGEREPGLARESRTTRSSVPGYHIRLASRASSETSTISSRRPSAAAAPPEAGGLIGVADQRDDAVDLVEQDA